MTRASARSSRIFQKFVPFLAFIFSFAGTEGLGHDLHCIPLSEIKVELLKQGSTVRYTAAPAGIASSLVSRLQLSPTTLEQAQKSLAHNDLTLQELRSWIDGASGKLSEKIPADQIDAVFTEALHRAAARGSRKFPNTLIPTEPTPEIEFVISEIATLEEWEKSHKPQIKQTVEHMEQGKISTPYSARIKEMMAVKRLEILAERPNIEKRSINPLIDQILMNENPEYRKTRTEEKAYIEARKIELLAPLQKNSIKLGELKKKYADHTSLVFGQVISAANRGFPYGFETKAAYQDFSRQFAKELRATLHRIVDSPLDLEMKAELQGSAVTGRSYSTPKTYVYPHAFGPESDFDVAVEVPEYVLNQMKEKIDTIAPTVGAPFKNFFEERGKTTDSRWLVGLNYENPNSPMGKLVEKLGMVEFFQSMSARYGRKTSVMFYGVNSISKRGIPSYPMNE
jgi:hypothetical protein